MRRTGSIAMLLSLLALAAAPAVGAAPVIGPTVDLAPETPGSLVLGPDGNLWVLLDGGAKELARVTPAGAVDKFDLNFTDNEDITTGRGAAAGPDDRLWISRGGGVTEVAPATGTPTDHAVATIAGARGIASDSQGDLWVVEADGLVEVGPDGVKRQDVAVAGAAGREIARLAGAASPSVVWSDFNGNVWTTTTTGVPTSVPVALVPPGGPQGIAASPTGFAVANPGASPQYVAVADPVFTQTPSPDKDPFGVTFGPDGAYWFAQFAGQDLGRLERGGAYTTPISFPAGSGPRRIAAGAGSSLWVGLETSREVARIDGVEPPAPPAPAPGPGPAPGAGPTPGPRDLVAPVVERLSASPSRFRSSGPGRGTRITVELSEGGRAAFGFARLAAGRRSGGRCLRPSRRLRRARACVRRVSAGTFTRSLPAGASRVRFTGRIGARPLAPGRYELTVRATDAAANRSQARRIRLVVRLQNRTRVR